MPSKKARAKASKQEVKHTFQKLNHKDNTPEAKKLKIARGHFLVQAMLGRPLKRYNLLYSTDGGDMFSSEDDLSEDLILSILRSKGVDEPINCGGWSLMYKLLSKDMDEDKKFYMYANLSSVPVTYSDHIFPGISIDKFEYFTWKETN